MSTLATTTTYEVEKFARGLDGHWFGFGTRRFRDFATARAYLLPIGVPTMSHTEREKTECQMRTFVRETADAIQRGDAEASAVLARLAFRRANYLRLTCPDCGDRLVDRLGEFLFTYCDTCDREVAQS